MRNRQRRMISERDRVKEEIATDGGRQRAGTWGDRGGRDGARKETGERDRREGERDRIEERGERDRSEREER